MPMLKTQNFLHVSGDHFNVNQQTVIFSPNFEALIEDIKITSRSGQLMHFFMINSLFVMRSMIIARDCRVMQST
jgi:thymidine kinase